LSADLHRKVKDIFAEICDLPQEVKIQRLDELARKEPEVAKEVKSLLAYHSEQSLAVESPPPKVRTRSTLSKTFRTRPARWMGLIARVLIYSLPIGLLGLLISYWTNHRIQFLLRGNVNSQLEDLIDQRLTQFRQWEAREISTAVSLTYDEQIVRHVRELVKSADELLNKNEGKLDSLRSAPQMAAIDSRLKQLAGSQIKFALWDRRMNTIADSDQQLRPELVGAAVTPGGAALLTEVLTGAPQLYLPSETSSITDGVIPEPNGTNVLVLAPITDETNTAIAVMMVRGAALEARYSQMFENWSRLPTSETYLVSERGALLTKSRYGEVLSQLGLAETEVDLNPAYYVRDPGVSLLAGEKSRYNSLAWPLTFSARQVTSGNNGISVEGYSNYVGRDVVGAWHWLPDHRIGMIVEEHVDDAFAIANTAKRSILWLSLLFALALAGVGLASVRRYARSDLSDISDVGPYQMQELLGEGGMGRVYLAEHALLCRQSAVKILSGKDIDLNVISRFEREVQLASQLTHPNTIAIYDFGRNKDGKFYYAMEYIHGAHLGQLVEYAGPLHPGRCIYILRQLCRALSEAHQAGVVHRDIKPQNVMVCNRGGEPDFVKLFDYGLVKAFAPGVSHGTASQTRVVVGTPRFMAPERLNSPWLADPRVDIYSVGAVAYYLLTGKLPPLFTMSGPASSEQPGIETLDLPVGAVEFGDLLGMCLSPEPSDRPTNMQSLMRDLEELSERFPWSREDSAVWWQNHEEKLLRLVKNRRKSLGEQKDQ
jgi:eukaryotic-like serine/threonine-protein kinase